MKKLIIALTIVLGSTSINAETLKGGYVACMSSNSFDEYVSALVDNDNRAMNYLMKTSCVMTKAGIEVTVLKRSWSGTAKIRIYSNSRSAVLWTFTENIGK